MKNSACIPAGTSLADQPRISLYKDILDKNPRAITFDDLITSIRNGRINDTEYQDIIDEIRQSKDKDAQSELKKKLPCVTVSGEFEGGHRKENLIKPSGFVQIDFDDLPDPQGSKEQLKGIPYIYMLFISPGGKGLKAICCIGEQDHEKAFGDIESYFSIHHGMVADRKVKEINRLCFLSYDPEIWVNKDVAPFRPPPADEKPVDAGLLSDVEEVVAQIEERRLDITVSYSDWLNIGFGLADSFGCKGAALYHRISRFYPGYDQAGCEKQFNSCLKSGGKGITIATFFKIARDHGLRIPTHHDQRSIDKQDNSAFYKPILDRYGTAKDVAIDYTRWTEILYNLGFRRYDLDRDFIFIHVRDQVVHEVTVTNIQDQFISYLNSLPPQLPDGITRDMIIAKFYKNPAHYFCENRLSLLKPREQLVFNEDTLAESYFYFDNGYVVCTGDGYKLLPYSGLKRLIWADRIVKQSFSHEDISRKSPVDRGVFSHFVYRICDNKQERYDALCSILGYLLHSYYDCKLKAVILTDSRISDAPSGRTGKTLLCQALGYLKKYTEINGKDFDPGNKHKYQLAELDTQIIHLNDVHRNFDLESVFNDITDNIIVDKKNVKPFRIRAKMVVSTNKPIRVEGASAKDRAIEFELADHYSNALSPQDEFGHWLFRDWNEAEWNRFFNFCLSCVCLYLDKGLISTPPVNLNKRKLLQETCREFYEFMTTRFEAGTYQVGVEYNKKDMYQAFLEEYPEMAEEKRNTQRRFTQWMHQFAMYSEQCGPIDQDMSERKSGDNRFIKFPPKDGSITFLKKTTSSASNRQKELRIKETSMDVSPMCRN